MMSRHYVMMKARPRGQGAKPLAPAGPVYEAERRAVTPETLQEWDVAAEIDSLGKESERSGVKVISRKDR